MIEKPFTQCAARADTSRGRGDQAAEFSGPGRAGIVALARLHIGTPWQHQGRTLAGLDCAGLVVRVWNGLGLPKFDRRDYGPQSDGTLLRNLLDKHFIRRRDAAPGAVTLMIHESARPQHLAIVTGAAPLFFVHAYAPARKVVEHRMAPALRLWPIAFYDFPITEELDANGPSPARLRQAPPDGLSRGRGVSDLRSLTSDL